MRDKVESCLRNIANTSFEIQIYDRDNYRKTLSELDLTPFIAAEVIRNLTVEDYYRGPTKPDHCDKGDIWEFGTKIDNIEVYIKLHIIEDFGVPYVTCISFHKAQWPINYPLRGDE